MAEEQKIVLQVGVETGDSIKSLGDLKKAIKAAQDEVIKGTPGAEKKLADLKDRFEDIGDATKAVKGQGIEPLRNSFQLFTEGLSNFDFGKIGTAFKGLGAAMKAVPIFLLVEGITYLITNFNELVNGTGILSKVLKPLGDLIGWITDGLYALTDAIGLTNSELDKMGEAAVENAKKAQDAISQQNAEYDRQIKVAKAAGKSTVELEQAKQQAIIDTNVQVVKQIEAFVRAGGVLDEEKKKLLTASLEAIKNAKVEEYVIEKDAQKKNIELYKNALEEKKRLKSLEFETNREFDQMEFDAQMELLNSLEAEKEARRLAEADKEAAYNAEKLAISAELQNTISAQETQRSKEAAEEKKKHNQEVFNNTVELAGKSLQATQALTDLFFTHQLKKARGNAEEEKRIKKKQFQLNKAFAITGAVIDGVRSVQAALTQTPPLSYILAALNGVLAAAAIAKIASAKFDDGGNVGGGDANIGNVSAGASAPAIQQPNNTVTKIDEEVDKEKQKTPTQKVVVVESDITDKQKQVAKIEETATI